MTDPITNADQAIDPRTAHKDTLYIEACRALLEKDRSPLFTARRGMVKDLVTAAEGMLKELAALHALKDQVASPSDGASETAWLVEFLPSGDHYDQGKRVGPAYPTRYYAGIRINAHQVKTRTEDPNKAMRFNRKQDAEDMIILLNDNDYGPVNAVAREHMWISSSPSDPAAGVTARELLAREFDKEGWQTQAHHVRIGAHAGDTAAVAIRAIEAALRPQPDLRALLENLRAGVGAIDSPFDQHSRAPENCAFQDAIDLVEQLIDRALGDGGGAPCD